MTSMGARLAVWAALVGSALAVAGCGDDAGESETASTSQDPGLVHIHGLGVNPSDQSLFVATHTGLFRAPEGEQTAERIAGRYQDTMGFTVVGPDRFLGSGHPDARENLPPFLGLIRSDDAGETWDSVSLLGQADFHVLEASGDLVYGYGSDFDTREQQLLVSADGGRSWSQRPLPEQTSNQLTEESLLSIAVNPKNPSSILASGQTALWRSADQGRHWTRASGDPGLLATTQGNELFRVSPGGKVSTSSDAGRTWADAGSLGGPVAAFEASGETLLAALHDGTVKQSNDGGATWRLRLAP